MIAVLIYCILDGEILTVSSLMLMMLTEMLLEGFGGSRTKRREDGCLLAALPTFGTRLYLRLTFAICCRAAMPPGKKL